MGTKARDEFPGSVSLPPHARELFEKPSFVFLATVGRDGTPHVTPVWADLDEGHIAVNTAEGRVKLHNLERDPRVGLSAVDPEDPYRMVSVQGRARLTREGADEHIDRLTRKYTGKDRYPWRAPGEVRVRVLVEPTWVATG